MFDALLFEIDSFLARCEKQKKKDDVYYSLFNVRERLKKEIKEIEKEIDCLKENYETLRSAVYQVQAVVNDSDVRGLV